LERPPLIRELHLGGGTPTFFSPQHLERLLRFITDAAVVHPHFAFSVEGHPNNTTTEHLQTLYQLGFRRISYGVQDNDPEVQRIINRIQPVANVQRATEEARRIGFESVNFDLIYGLPRQTVESITRTIQQVVLLQPDRIAFYSYAHVPWTSKGQRLFDERDLPDAATKLQLYLRGKELLIAAGYTDIGMDHFALPTDELYNAWNTGRLHRNFMGYTTRHTTLLLGLGVSSISDTGTAFAQNNKVLKSYYDTVRKGELPVVKGYFLNEEDLDFRKYILDISCKGHTRFDERHLPLLETWVLPQLYQLQADGLIDVTTEELHVTTTGRPFIRTICSKFDLHLQRQQQTSDQPVFSKAI
jgi:oxygen-independent coproporphyrinogen-3 oxidase